MEENSTGSTQSHSISNILSLVNRSEPIFNEASEINSEEHIIDEHNNNNNIIINAKQVKVGSDFKHHFIDTNLVRKLVAQFWPESICILVIIIYLIYYFSQLSRKPKLIGNNGSPFVGYIRHHLRDTLEHSFRPLIYWWGTNPQTCLFGYLQGQTSLTKSQSDSMIKRQYLYVSDLQYLTSNVDLSEHYHDLNKEIKIRLKCLRSSSARHLADELQCRANNNNNNNNNSSSSNNSNNNNNGNSNSNNNNNSTSECERKLDQLQLNQNIRLALEGMISTSKENQNRLIRTESRVQMLDVQSCAHHNISPSNKSAPNYNKQASLSEQHSSAASTSSDSGHSSTISGLVSGSGSASSSASTASLHEDSSHQDQQSLCDECADNSYGTNMSDSYASSIGGKSSTNQSSLDPKRLSGDSLFERYSQSRKNNKRLSEQMDFGQCALDWFVGGHENYHKNKLVALISAGMTTGSDKKYVTDSVKTLESLGYECCVFIRRGVGGLKLNSAKFFSCSKWRDFEAAVQSVRQQRPNARLVAIGFSFGSVELCRYLAMSGNQSLVDAALLVSCPFEPVCGALNMHHGSYLNRRIDAYLAKNLGKQLYRAMLADHRLESDPKDDLESGPQMEAKPKAKQQNKNHKQLKLATQNQIWTSENGSTINLAYLPKLKSLYDFEYNFNRVVQHYPTPEAYARDCKIDLARIVTPTLCLSSEDDFMAPLKLLPLEQIRANDNLCMVLTKRGGHMAFIDGLWWPKKPYFAQRIIASYMGAIKQSMSSIGEINLQVS